MCVRPLQPRNLGSGSCVDESAQRWLGSEQSSPSPAYLRPQECLAQRGSSALLLHPAVLRATLVASGRACTLADLCPARGSSKWDPQSLPGVGSVHSVYVIPAGPGKKGSCKDINSCLFEGSGGFHWHFTLVPLLGTYQDPGAPLAGGESMNPPKCFSTAALAGKRHSGCHPCH